MSVEGDELLSRLLRIKDVCHALSIAESSFRDRVRAGIFPPPIKHGRLSFWREDEIESIARFIAKEATNEELKKLTSVIVVARDARR